jgi:hypothetical protein
MILVLGRRIFRLVVFTLVLLLILPVLQYYFLRALDPQYVQFHEPRGNALKVSADLEDNGLERSKLSRLQYYLHDFYQNGI